MRSEIKGFGKIVLEIISEICEKPTYANPIYARFTVYALQSLNIFEGMANANTTLRRRDEFLPYRSTRAFSVSEH